MVCFVSPIAVPTVDDAALTFVAAAAAIVATAATASIA
jgi:hypothetical protein